MIVIMISKLVNLGRVSSGLAAVLFCFLLTTLSAHAADKLESWTGYLVDRSCAAMIKKEGKDIPRQVKEHTKSCSLDATCSEAGYTVYCPAAGANAAQWLDLDNASSQIARKLLESTKKAKGNLVKMTGIVKRGEVKASSIVEVNQ